MKPNIWIDVLMVLIILFVFIATIAAVTTSIHSVLKPPIPEALFTKDGCTVYKWYDKGNRMYFTKCEDGSTPSVSR